MNILFAANGYVNRGIPKDGFPMYLYKVSHALKKLGHTPIIVYCSDKESVRVEDGIKIYEIKCRFVRFEKSWLNAVSGAVCRSFFINKRIKELIVSENIQLIQFTSLNAISLFYYGKIPAVMRLSSYTKKQNPTYDTMDKHTIFAASLLELLAGKRCNAVFAPSNVMANAFEKDFKKPAYVIETPYVRDVRSFDDTFYESRLKGKKYVLFFGRMYYAKGITVIADILEKFLQEHRDYHFVFVGDALTINGRAAVDIIMEGAGKCRDRVIISKSLEHKKLYPVIKYAEFVVLPSIIDNFPNACVEAMALSKVVIGTEGASFEQLIEHQYSGILCRIGDPKDLLMKMEMAINMSDQDKKDMGRRAEERIARLNPDNVVKELLRFYEAVINVNYKRK